MKKLVDFEFFEEGDYSESGKGKWTEKDFEKAYEYLQRTKQDIPVVLNPKEAHDTKDSKNLATPGHIKYNEIWRKPNGVWSGNGEFLKELAWLIKEKLYRGKSIGLVRTKEGEVKIDHIALCGAQKAHLDHLKPNDLSIFDTPRLEKLKHVQLFSSQNEGDDCIEINYSSQSVDEDNGVDSSENQGNEEKNQSGDSEKTKSKEKETIKMSEDVKISQDKHDRILQEKLLDKEREMKKEFADTESNFTNTIKSKADEIKAKDKTIAEKDSEISVFSESIKEKDAEIKKLKEEKEAMQAEFKKVEEKAIKEEIFNYVNTSKKIKPKDKPQMAAELVRIRFDSGEKGYKLIKNALEKQSDEITFGIDGNFSTNDTESEYEKFIKLNEDDTGRRTEFNLDEFYKYEQRKAQ
jgi:hypothetical protein